MASIGRERDLSQMGLNRYTLKQLYSEQRGSLMTWDYYGQEAPESGADGPVVFQLDAPMEEEGVVRGMQDPMFSLEKSRRFQYRYWDFVWNS